MIKFIKHRKTFQVLRQRGTSIKSVPFRMLFLPHEVGNEAGNKVASEVVSETADPLQQAQQVQPSPIKDWEISAGDNAWVGFALPRSLGKAVKRNKLKRRMKEALGTINANTPLPSGAYLFKAEPSAVSMKYGEVLTALTLLIEKANHRIASKDFAHKLQKSNA